MIDEALGVPEPYHYLLLFVRILGAVDFFENLEDVLVEIFGLLEDCEGDAMSADLREVAVEYVADVQPLFILPFLLASEDLKIGAEDLVLVAILALIKEYTFCLRLQLTRDVQPCPLGIN